MRLDITCLKDILSVVEAHEEPMYMRISDFTNLLPQYSSTEIEYCCRRLDEGGLLNVYYYEYPELSLDISEIKCIGDLTFYGHEFLSDIKNPDTWEKIKSIFSQGGSASIKTIREVAVELGVAYLKRRFGINN